MTMTHAEVVANFTAFKNSKADGSLTVQQVVTKYNKMYEQERQLRKASELAKQNAEKDAEIARLKALVDGKKATGKTA
jgi:hypothetical protein